MAEKALLVVSFGTSYAQTRERTIGAIEGKLAERFPDRIVRRAWTSSFLIKKVAKTEGLIVDTPEEAFEKLAEEGVKDVIVQPTHLSDGYENQRMMEIVRRYADRFEQIAVGRPLLFTAEDRDTVAHLMPQLCLGDSDEDRALLLMGHGSDTGNEVYARMQEWAWVWVDQVVVDWLTVTESTLVAAGEAYSSEAVAILAELLVAVS